MAIYTEMNFSFGSGFGPAFIFFQEATPKWGYLLIDGELYHWGDTPEVEPLIKYWYKSRSGLTGKGRIYLPVPRGCNNGMYYKMSPTRMKWGTILDRHASPLWGTIALYERGRWFEILKISECEIFESLAIFKDGEEIFEEKIHVIKTPLGRVWAGEPWRKLRPRAIFIPQSGVWVLDGGYRAFGADALSEIKEFIREIPW